MKKLCVSLVLLLVAGTAGAGEFVIPKTQTAGELIPNQYVVRFTPGAASGNAHALAGQLARTHGARILFVYDALGGAAFAMNENAARAMANNPNVTLVEQDVMFHVVGDQANPPWGLDRIDQRNLPLDNIYHWDFDGTGVTAFIVDTGIRTTHNDFGGRASWGMDCTGVGQVDDHGHGTHVAGTVGSATYGVAKNVDLVAVKVCNSSGSCQGAWTSCGLNFVANQKLACPLSPMVGNYSIGGPFSQTSNDSMAAVIATGVFFAVAAGNSNANACNFSPASEPTAFTVGSTTTSDSRSSFSNFGTCVDIFAPGSSIVSTWNTSDTATNTISGTSMASPHAAGAGALVLQQHPTWSPAEVSAELVARGTSGVLSGVGTGSPNLLLYTLDTGAPPPPPPPPLLSTYVQDPFPDSLSISQVTLVEPGIDTLVTSPGTLASVNLPQNFFCGGSAPVNTIVRMRGVPLTTNPPNALGEVSTVIERVQEAVVPSSGCATVDTKVRAVSLTNEPGQELVVSCPGVGNTTWKVDACTCLTPPMTEQPTTTLTLCDDGSGAGCGSTCGNLTGDLPINVCFTFTNTDDGTVHGPVSDLVTLEVDTPWCDTNPGTVVEHPDPLDVDTDCDGQAELTVPGTTNFFFGATCGGAGVTSSAGTEAFSCRVCPPPHCHKGPDHMHCVEPRCP